MKSGIFQSEKGDLIYVAKDRSVRAVILANGTSTVTSEAHRKEFRVTSRNKDQAVEVEDGTVYTRYADVPNGCTDPLSAIATAVLEKQPAEEASLDAEVASLGHADNADELRQQFKRDGFRFCHGQSARKHRRAGHVVRYVPELRQYAWAAR